MSNNLDLALPIYRDAIPPGAYGSFTDTERSTDCRPAAKIIDSVLDVHALSMAWQTEKSSANDRTLALALAQAPYITGLEPVFLRAKKSYAILDMRRMLYHTYPHQSSQAAPPPAKPASQPRRQPNEKRTHHPPPSPDPRVSRSLHKSPFGVHAQSR